MTATSSQPSSPQLSRICLVACTSSGTVEYSHFCMGSNIIVSGAARLWRGPKAPPASPFPLRRAPPALARFRRDRRDRRGRDLVDHRLLDRYLGDLGNGRDSQLAVGLDRG